jgi:arginase
MTSHTDLTGLHVVALRYRDTYLASDDERGIDAYAASGVYERAGVPVKIGEPRLRDDVETGDRIVDLGLLNAEIAEQVATATAGGQAVLLTGGNCTHITGVFGGLQDAYGPAVRVGLVWFDAHGDFNTPAITPSGMLGGMPVAVCAGLCFPQWRDLSHIVAPLPADRIVMVDVRNLDPDEENLIRTVGIPIVPVDPVGPGTTFDAAVADVAERCDVIYLHIDSDILDESYVPGHATREPNGPDMDTVLAAVDRVMATGKVAVYAVVSVYAGGEGRDIAVKTGTDLIRGGLESWRRHGTVRLRDTMGE